MTNEKKELQQKYVELQMIDSQVNQVQKQIQALDSQLMELEMVNKSLEDFEDIKTGTEILVPLNSGIYARTELKNNKDLVVNVGSNIFVEKKIPSTKKIISNQVEEMKKIREQMIADIQRLILKAGSIEKEISGVISKKG